MNEIINKVALSGIITLDLLQYKPKAANYTCFDIVPFLVKGYLLPEKAFRADMLEHNWQQYQNQEVVLYCSNDAIVPYWAWVYLSTLLQPYARFVLFSDQQDPRQLVWAERIRRLDMTPFADKKVVLKASSDVPPELYVIAAKKLTANTQSLMWGEAGSPVMIYKKKKTI